MHISRPCKKFFRYAAAVATAAITAAAGTVSPQLRSMPANQPVEVIVQHTQTLLGGLLGTVCSTLNLIQILPLGEVCTTTVAGALDLATKPGVAHVSVNNVLFGTGTATPLYDYMPETISPSSTTGPANYKLGSGVGVAVIDSGIHVNQDLIGTGTKGLILQNLFPNVVYAESFVKGEGIDDYYGHGTHVAGIIAGNGANSNGSNYQFNIHGVAPGA
ncbi:MAG TPA: S8 family serine peptidase, partial [Tepidisphaeraceae bacterium]|nr:S8 family serine peptidase [Tepidisphaeraceae bacterium]